MSRADHQKSQKGLGWDSIQATTLTELFILSVPIVLSIELSTPMHAWVELEYCPSTLIRWLLHCAIAWMGVNIVCLTPCHTQYKGLNQQLVLRINIDTQKPKIVSVSEEPCLHFWSTGNTYNKYYHILSTAVMATACCMCVSVHVHHWGYSHWKIFMRKSLFQDFQSCTLHASM